MTYPASISIPGFTYLQTTDIWYFRNTSGRHKGRRRIGLPYYVLFQEDPSSPGILVEYVINEKTDLTWLQSALELGLIYLDHRDVEILKPGVEGKGNGK